MVTVLMCTAAQARTRSPTPRKDSGRRTRPAFTWAITKSVSIAGPPALRPDVDERSSLLACVIRRPFGGDGHLVDWLGTRHRHADLRVVVRFLRCAGRAVADEVDLEPVLESCENRLGETHLGQNAGHD